MFKNIQYFTEYEILGLFREYSEPTFKALPSHCGQEIIKNLFKNVKSWQKARKEYEKNPNKFLGRPKMPKYKKELSILGFNNCQVKLKNGYIHFPKIIGISPMKTNINIGGKNNQNFVSLPHTQLVNLIEYKGKRAGIEVVKTEESYTSKCSALDLEPICKHEEYVGRRTKRGLFRTKSGLKINADQNGATNILRKVIGNDFVVGFNKRAVIAPVKMQCFEQKLAHKQRFKT